MSIFFEPNTERKVSGIIPRGTPPPDVNRNWELPEFVDVTMSPGLEQQIRLQHPGDDMAVVNAKDVLAKLLQQGVSRQAAEAIVAKQFQVSLWNRWKQTVEFAALGTTIAGTIVGTVIAVVQYAGR